MLLHPPPTCGDSSWLGECAEGWLDVVDAFLWEILDIGGGGGTDEGTDSGGDGVSHLHDPQWLVGSGYHYRSVFRVFADCENSGDGDNACNGDGGHGGGDDNHGGDDETETGGAHGDNTISLKCGAWCFSMFHHGACNGDGDHGGDGDTHVGDGDSGTGGAADDHLQWGAWCFTPPWWHRCRDRDLGGLELNNFYSREAILESLSSVINSS